MDPIMIAAIVVLVAVIAMRVFFGLTKMVLRLIAVVVICIVIWRALHGSL